MASTSAWKWDHEYMLYYNAATRQWAKPGSNGQWTYTSPTYAASVLETKRGFSSCPDDETEEGEIAGMDILERQPWPDKCDNDSATERLMHRSAYLLRLVVETSDVIKPPSRIVIVDHMEPLSIGRDKCTEKRIRLKELVVSKTHATLFWMEDVDERGDRNGLQGNWAIADAGSMHGTFLKRSRTAEKELRLSGSRSASKPFLLQHLDKIRIGSSTFEVHMHPNFACDSCTIAPDSSDVIALTGAPSSIPTNTGSYVDSLATTKAGKEQIRRETMRALKEKLLQPNLTSAAVQIKPTRTAATKPDSSRFSDRAAARRKRLGKETAAVPSMAISSVSNQRMAVKNPTKDSNVSSTPFGIDVHLDPFANTSKGAQLLSKMAGPEAGCLALKPVPKEGLNEIRGLGELIKPRFIDQQRAGLGSRPLIPVMASLGEDKSVDGSTWRERGGRQWREDVKEMSRKRFKGTAEVH